MRQWIGLACALACAGCATITQGTTEQVSIDSVPAGAEARSVIENACEDGSCTQTVQGAETVRVERLRRDAQPGPACVTPCTLALDKGSTYRITFSKPGFEPVAARLKRQVAVKGAAGFAGNVILGGAVGGVIDVASGAALEHCPNPLVATLRRAGSTVNVCPGPDLEAQQDEQRRAREGIN